MLCKDAVIAWEPTRTKRSCSGATAVLSKRSGARINRMTPSSVVSHARHSAAEVSCPCASRWGPLAAGSTRASARCAGYGIRIALDGLDTRRVAVPLHFHDHRLETAAVA